MSLSDTVRTRKNSSTPIASETTDDKGTPDKSTKTSNRNLTQGQQTDTVLTTTSYFDPVLIVFSQYTDGSYFDPVLIVFSQYTDGSM